jgi:hypothetical protein
MINANEGKKAIQLKSSSTSATAACSLVVDTKGSDQLNVDVAIGSHNTSSAAVSSIAVSESDTGTSGTHLAVVAALSSGTATSTSAGNILHLGAVMGLGGNVNELQIDLRKRKRYVSVVATLADDETGIPCSVSGRFTRNEQSKDSAAQKSGINLADTSVVAAMAVITT